MDDLVKRLKTHLRWNRKTKDPVGGVFRARPPASERDVVATEKRIGFNLPHTLREIYSNVANGGFGPGYGVMGVEGGFTDDMGNTVADLFESYRHSDPEDPTWQWPDRFLPICHWGCVVYSAIDCSGEQSSVYYVDVGVKEPGEPMESIIKLHKPSIEVWLSDWLDGKDLWHEVWS
jgi:hypothetical protein